MILTEHTDAEGTYWGRPGVNASFGYDPHAGELFDSQPFSLPIAYPATLAEARKILTDAGHTLKENA